MARPREKVSVHLLRPTDAGSVRLKRSRRERSRDGTLTETTAEGTTSNRSDTYHGGSYQSGVRMNVQYEPTYRMSPDVLFDVPAVEHVTRDVLEARLKDVRYDPTECKVISQELAALVLERVKALELKRYKVVAVVSIGSLREKPGLQFGSRCLWNKETDSFASIKYTNDSLFAVAMVYGMYFE